jgi:ATP-dependent Zn protease
VVFTQQQCNEFIAQVMVGRAAELVCLGSYTSQCEADIKTATKYAYTQVSILPF